MEKMICGLALVALAGVAHADTITAKYDIPWNPGNNAFVQIRMPSSGSDPATREVSAVITNGLRQDLPAGPGVDATIAQQFPTFCVEIDENVQVSVGGVFNASTYTHEVLGLLGSTTAAGGISGPVTFDAVRTSRLERLWGGYFDNAVQTSQNSSLAFQLAVWEIAFETSPTLDLFDGSSRFSVTNGLTGVNFAAQFLLSTVDSPGPSTPLYLLRAEGAQDLITPVPAPSAIGVIAVAGLAACRRRR